MVIAQLTSCARNEIEMFTSKFAAKKAKLRRHRLNNLNIKLRELLDDQCTSLVDSHDEIRRVQDEIEDVYQVTVKASIFRSKAQ